ncbi:MAG: D-amino-acid oxidase [Actinomycetota bacterium]|nr:D-amino-acid oxidase [Actinomycetota bacterium]
MAQRVVLVGAGVMGLSCAVRLAEAGYAVDVLAKDLPRETASARAPGLWLPPPGARDTDRSDTDPRVRRFALGTLAELRRLSSLDGTGVRLVEGYLLHAVEAPLPAWVSGLGPDMAAEAVRDPAPGYPFGFRLVSPVVDMPVYLEYLRARLLEAGGTLTRLALQGLPRQGLVVNCSGPAARALVPDPRVRPAVEQTVLLGGVRVGQWYRDADRGGAQLRYLVPHGERTVVGGIVHEGVWKADLDPADGRRLVGWARDVEPALEGAEILGHRSDPRPAASRIRVGTEHHREDGEEPVRTRGPATGPGRGAEEQASAGASGRFCARRFPGLLRVHCYGSGDRGLTLSWGCAGEVLRTLNSMDQARGPTEHPGEHPAEHPGEPTTEHPAEHRAEPEDPSGARLSP